MTTFRSYAIVSFTDDSRFIQFQEDLNNKVKDYLGINYKFIKGVLVLKDRLDTSYYKTLVSILDSVNYIKDYRFFYADKELDLVIDSDLGKDSAFPLFKASDALYLTTYCEESQKSLITESIICRGMKDYLTYVKPKGEDSVYDSNPIIVKVIKHLGDKYSLPVNILEECNKVVSISSEFIHKSFYEKDGLTTITSPEASEGNFLLITARVYRGFTVKVDDLIDVLRVKEFYRFPSQMLYTQFKDFEVVDYKIYNNTKYPTSYDKSTNSMNIY